MNMHCTAPSDMAYILHFKDPFQRQPALPLARVARILRGWLKLLREI